MMILALSAHIQPANAKALSWTCAFERRIDEDGANVERFTLKFRYDSMTEWGFMEGNLGIAEVELHNGSETVSFTEYLETGAVQTTTINENGDAIHSRNTVLLGEIVAAQHFGHCVPS